MSIRNSSASGKALPRAAAGEHPLVQHQAAIAKPVDVAVVRSRDVTVERHRHLNEYFAHIRSSLSGNQTSFGSSTHRCAARSIVRWSDSETQPNGLPTGRRPAATSAVQWSP